LEIVTDVIAVVAFVAEKLARLRIVQRHQRRIPFDLVRLAAGQLKAQRERLWRLCGDGFWSKSRRASGRSLRDFGAASKSGQRHDGTMVSGKYVAGAAPMLAVRLCSCRQRKSWTAAGSHSRTSLDSSPEEASNQGDDKQHDRHPK